MTCRETVSKPHPPMPTTYAAAYGYSVKWPPSLPMKGLAGTGGIGSANCASLKSGNTWDYRMRTSLAIAVGCDIGGNAEQNQAAEEGPLAPIRALADLEDQ
jgi:hypothetical protein